MNSNESDNPENETWPPKPEPHPDSSYSDTPQRNRDQNGDDTRQGILPPVGVRQIGPYRLLEPLGEGGMGTVYMAEQREPVHRRVALKIIKAGMDTGQIIARFEAERQALAMMDHANIAKVLDAGATPTGQPYFVMELVKGQPITSYCDNYKLGIPERLDLFADVCRAVQHAHQKGIIHRDLKPSNILVALKDDKPVAKVIDFGLAKATNQRLTEKTMFTAHGQVMGTPEYMSPEQAQLNDLDIDTRSDIYSLGIILYELLTGSTPLKRESLLNAGFLEILARIWEEEPERPSSRISESDESLASISSLRQVEPRRFSSMMKGDLDWIVLKAMEKDRSRRYETANGFAADIARYLNDEPIIARPPSAGYRFQKLIRKNRVAVIFASTVAALLLLGIGVSASLAMWAFNEAELASIAEISANTERAKTETALDKAESRRIAAEESEKRATAILEVVTEAFQSTDLFDGAHYDMLASDILKRAYSNLDAKLADDPVGRVTLLNPIADSLYRAGDYELAFEAAELSASISSKVLGEFAPQTLDAEDRHVLAILRLGKANIGLEIARRIEKRRRAHLGEGHDATLRAKGLVVSALKDTKQFTEALAICERLVALREKTPSSESNLNISPMHQLGYLLYKTGEKKKALEIRQQVLQTALEEYGHDHLVTLTAEASLADSLFNDGQTSEALAMGEKVLSTRQKVYGYEGTFGTMKTLARWYNASGDTKRAIELLEVLVRKLENSRGIDNSQTIEAVNSLAKIYQSTGAFENVIELRKKIKSVRFVVPETCSLEFIQKYGALMRTLVENNPNVATDFTNRYLEITKRTPADSTEDEDRLIQISLGHDMAFLSETLLKIQAFKDCEKVAKVCLGYRVATEPNQWWTQFTRHVLAASLLAQEGKENQAESVLNSMVDLEKINNAGALSGNMLILINNMIAEGQSAICEPMARCVVEGYRRAYPKSASFSYAQCALAHVLSQTERLGEATSLFNEGYSNLISRRLGFRSPERYSKLINATSWQVQHNERVGAEDTNDLLRADLLHYERQHRRQVVLDEFKILDSSQPEFVKRIQEIENTFITNEQPGTSKWRTNRLEAAWIAGLAVHLIDQQPQASAAAMKRLQNYFIELRNNADLDSSDNLNWMEAIQHLEMLEKFGEGGEWETKDSMERVTKLLPFCTHRGRQTVCSAINNKAWKYSTSPSASDRNGELAVELAMLASQHCNDRFRPSYLDSLAAAYAETEQWEKAETTISQAIAGANSEKDRTNFEVTLQRIKARKSIRAK